MTSRTRPFGIAWAALVAAWGLVVGGGPLLLGPPGGDDAYYHAMRAQQEAHCWRAGVLLPVWYPDLNASLGGPEPRAYPVFPLVAHGIFALMLDDGVSATSMATLLIPALAGLVMLTVIRRRGAPWGAASAAACVWAAMPYLVVAIHERASLAEGWGLAVLPWVFDALASTPSSGASSAVRGGVAFALLLSVQLPLAAMTAFLALVVRITTMREHRDGYRTPVSLALGLGLAACSWMPNVGSVFRLQGQQLVGPGYRWPEHLVPRLGGLEPELARHILLACLTVALAAVIAAAAGRGTARKLAWSALLATAMTTPLSWWLYRWFPGFDFLQFPWRWIGPASCLAVLSLAALSNWRHRFAGYVVLLLALSPVSVFGARLAAGPPMRPSDDARTVALAATRYGVPPILPSLPAYLPRGVDLAEALQVAPSARARLPEPEMCGPRAWRWRVEESGTRLVVFPLLFDDGWRVDVDGVPAPAGNSRGLLAASVPSGRHVLHVRQRMLPETAVGLALSLATLVGIVSASLAMGRRRRRQGPLNPPGSRAGDEGTAG